MLRPGLSGAMVVMAACGSPQPNDEGTASTGESTGEASSTAGTTTEPTTSASTTSASTTTTSTTSASTTSDTTTGGVCMLPPLSEEVVATLGFDIFGSTFEMQPGQTASLALGAIECCYFKNEVDACITYSVSPSEGATIDPATGEFTVLADAEPGTVYTVTADVEDGRAVLMAEVYVYTPESNPFVGIWHEAGELPCGGGPEVAPEVPIGELWFRASGDVMVTWMPFEIYVDYWGQYTYDLMTGALTITVDGGNYEPPDVDGEGSFTVMGDELILEDMWLGTAQGAMGLANCGHRFTR